MCVGIVVATRRRRILGAAGTVTRASDGTALADPPAFLSPFRSTGTSLPTRALLATAIGAGAVAAAVSRWWIGLVVGVAVLVASRVASGRIVFCAGAPIALAVSKLASVPELGWLAVVLLGADVVVLWLRDRTTRP